MFQARSSGQQIHQPDWEREGEAPRGIHPHKLPSLRMWIFPCGVRSSGLSPVKRQRHGSFRGLSAHVVSDGRQRAPSFLVHGILGYRPVQGAFPIGVCLIVAVPHGADAKVHCYGSAPLSASRPQVSFRPRAPFGLEPPSELSPSGLSHIAAVPHGADAKVTAKAVLLSRPRAAHM